MQVIESYYSLGSSCLCVGVNGSVVCVHCYTLVAMVGLTVAVFTFCHDALGSMQQK